MIRRLVTLGDSTLDSGRYSGTSAPEHLARSLKAELVHLAKDGHTAKNVLDQQLKRLPAPAADTALIVSVGGNDLLYALTHPDMDESRRFGKWVREILARTKERLSPGIIVIANVYRPASDLVKWIGDPEKAIAIHARWNAEIAGAAREHRATLVDLAAAFAEQPTWIVDRIEPSAEGARAIARLLEAALNASGAAP